MATLHTLSDYELLSLLKDNDHAAFNEIYNRYWEFLYRAAYSILKDSAACDDIVQELFVWLWVNRKKHITDAIKPYLYTAVKYKIANLIRHRKVQEAFYTRTVINYNTTIAEENNYDARELKAIIFQFTESLPDRARQIFHLSRHELLSNKEIAEKLGISEKTVENQMNINLKKLRFSLGKLSFWSVLL